jgi:hypothetical protein
MTRAAHTAQSPHTSRRRATRHLALGLACAAGLATAGTAGALQPPDGINPQNLPIPPVAALSATPNPVVVPRPLVVRPGQVSSFLLGPMVNFSAAGSFDPNGTIVKYDWDVDGQPGFEATTKLPSHSRRHSQPGAIPVRVRVTDNHGLTAIRTINLVRHFAPIARPAASKPVALVGRPSPSTARAPPTTAASPSTSGTSTATASTSAPASRCPCPSATAARAR